MIYIVEHLGMVVAHYKTLQGALNFVKRNGYRDSEYEDLRLWERESLTGVDFRELHPFTGEELKEEE